MAEAENLKVKALHCRTLARSVGEEGVRLRLIHMADDYDARAVKMELPPK